MLLMGPPLVIMFMFDQLHWTKCPVIVLTNNFICTYIIFVNRSTFSCCVAGCENLIPMIIVKREKNIQILKYGAEHYTCTYWGHLLAEW